MNSTSILPVPDNKTDPIHIGFLEEVMDFIHTEPSYHNIIDLQNLITKT